MRGERRESGQRVRGESRWHGRETGRERESRSKSVSEVVGEIRKREVGGDMKAERARRWGAKRERRE